jgi:hypothetical protein
MRRPNFSSTGEAVYEDAFWAYSPLSVNSGQVQSLKGSVLAALYAYASTPTADPGQRQRAVQILVQRLEEWHNLAPKSGYRLSKHPYAPVISSQAKEIVNFSPLVHRRATLQIFLPYYLFGTYTTPRETDQLFRTHFLTGDERFLIWGLQTVDASLGHNAHGLSWTTGIGVRAVKWPLSNHSLGDGIDQAIPGITVFGPDWSAKPIDIAAFLVGHYDPSLASWPAAERFADLSYVPIFNEYTIHDSIVPTTFAFGYLAVLKNPAE